MTSQDASTPAPDTPTRFTIERLESIDGRDSWLVVGDVEVDDKYPTHRTALVQFTSIHINAVAGAYRVLCHHEWGITVEQFDVIEHTELRIERIQHPQEEAAGAPA